MIHKTVPLCIMEVMLAYEEKQREQWVFDYPAQVAPTEGLASALKDCHKRQVTQLNALITVLLGELSSGDRQIMTFCTIDVHTGDVVASLVIQKVCVWIAFAWLSQLHRRWDGAQKHCFANINTPRLIITPLTDRYANNHFSCVQVLHYSNPVSPPNKRCCCRTSQHSENGDHQRSRLCPWYGGVCLQLF
uniref:Uncharacterized protein n=1 Tax=Athene cunicularia TaxID=194338 RepID=A0A663MKH5_ATHCN